MTDTQAKHDSITRVLLAQFEAAEKELIRVNRQDHWVVLFKDGGNMRAMRISTLDKAAAIAAVFPMARIYTGTTTFERKK